MLRWYEQYVTRAWIGPASPLPLFDLRPASEVLQNLDPLGAVLDELRLLGFPQPDLQSILPDHDLLLDLVEHGVGLDLLGLAPGLGVVSDHVAHAVDLPLQQVQAAHHPQGALDVLGHHLGRRRGARRFGLGRRARLGYLGHRGRFGLAESQTLADAGPGADRGRGRGRRVVANVGPFAAEVGNAGRRLLGNVRPGAGSVLAPGEVGLAPRRLGPGRGGDAEVGVRLLEVVIVWRSVEVLLVVLVLVVLLE